MTADALERISEQPIFRAATQAAPRLILLEQALAAHEAGQLELAQATYRRILDTEPNDGDVLHLYGVVAHQLGQHAVAVEYIERAIDLNPGIPLYYNNLGSAYRALKLMDEAFRCLKQSLALKPDSADALYNLGVVLSDGGDCDEAESCFRKAIDLRPGLLQAHFNLGILLRRAGRMADAAHSFEQVLRIDPDNATARFLSAAAGGQHADRAPTQYVAEVFDTDAEKFDQHLVGVLRYDTPQRLLEMSAGLLKPDCDNDLLDIGCGTGLVGASFAPFSRNMVGVDLSQNMLVRARARKLYRRLEHAELLQMMLAEKPASYDIVVAADVFIYLGRLDDIFCAVKQVLRGGGLFTFSAESLDALQTGQLLPGDAPGYRLHAGGRFAHSAAYVRALALDYGFRVNTMLCAPARLENGKEVLAWLVLLQSETDD